MRKYDILFIQTWLSQFRQHGEVHLLLMNTHLFPLSTELNISKLFLLCDPETWKKTSQDWIWILVGT